MYVLWLMHLDHAGWPLTCSHLGWNLLVMIGLKKKNPICYDFNFFSVFKYKPPSCQSPSESRTLSPSWAEEESCKDHRKPMVFFSFNKQRIYWVPKGKGPSKACIRKVNEFPSRLTNWWVLSKNWRTVIITQFHFALLELGQKKSPDNSPGLGIGLSSTEAALLKTEGCETSKV